MSAIPWVGHDIVESKNITECGTIVATALVMPTIGTVSPHALKKGNKKIRLDKKEYLSIPSSFLAFLVGLIDGDGYIQVTRTTKGFITIKLVISLHLEDISTLEYIRSVLKIGKLTIYRDLKSPCCRLVINRTDLQEVLFPLLIHHGIFFLTETRKAQFDLAMFILKNDKKVYSQLPAIEDIPATFELPKTASDFTNLAFFKNWIVGLKNPSKYPGVVEFVYKNPLTYKRVKAEFKKMCNKKSYHYIKRVIKQQNNNVKYYSTSSYSTFILNPWYVTGFSDGEANFTIIISKNKGSKLGWKVQPSFQIHLHKKDMDLLIKIKSFLGVGEIYERKESCIYIVNSLNDLQIIIEHFDKYSLITQKQADYQLFKRAFELIKNKNHLTPDGFRQILSIRAAINLGLSDFLKEAYPETIPVERPLVIDQEIKDPNWVVGFIEAEGCFQVKLYKSNTNIGLAVNLRFNITQHTRDLTLLNSLINYFDCGIVKIRPTGYACDFYVLKLSDILSKIVPFLYKYPLIGAKRLDFMDFCKVANLMNEKAHLKQEGILEIQKIKAGMNTGRK